MRGRGSEEGVKKVRGISERVTIDGMRRGSMERGRGYGEGRRIPDVRLAFRQWHATDIERPFKVPSASITSHIFWKSYLENLFRIGEFEIVGLLLHAKFRLILCDCLVFSVGYRSRRMRFHSGNGARNREASGKETSCSPQRHLFSKRA